MEADLQRRSERTRAANADGLHDVLRALGDLTAAEAQQRCLEAVSAKRMLDRLVAERRAARMRIGGEERYIAAEDAGLYRDALGAVPPGGLPDVFLEPVEEPLRRIARRFARTHGPFTTARAAAAATASTSARCCASSSAPAAWCAASCGPAAPSASGATRTCCAACAARRWPRCARRSSRPTSARSRGSSPPGRASMPRRRARAGVDRLREILVPLQGLALTPEVWEQRRAAAAGRCATRRPGWTRSAPAASWCGSAPARSVAAAAGWRSTSARTPAGSARRRTRPSVPAEPLHEPLRERLERGACFWTDLLVDIAAEPAELQEALWDLVWAGEVTNDAFAPLRAPRLSLARRERERGRRFAARRRPSAPQIQGRWSLTAPLFADAPQYGPRMRALAELLLERYGIVTRETVLAEGVPGGFASLYGELVNLETLGTARRGYFVEGLGGAQFALGGAVERLRSLRDDEPAGALVLAATDPANPYGASLPWPKRDDAPSAAAARARGRCVRGHAATPSRCSTSSAAARACCRCASRTGSGCGPRSRRWPTTCAAAASSGWRSSASTASRWRARRSSSC